MWILVISWPWALFGSNFWIIFAMSSEPTSMGEITFPVCLNKTKGSTLELFVREHWLEKKLLNYSVLSLHLVMYVLSWNSGEMQGIFLLFRNDFKIDQYVLELVTGFIIFFEIDELYFSLLAPVKDFNSS